VRRPKGSEYAGEPRQLLEVLARQGGDRRPQRASRAVAKTLTRATRQAAGTAFAPWSRLVAKLKDKIQNALDEVRMMVLGIQVLIGFDFRAAFEPGFEHLPRLAQLLKLGSVSVLCISLALLITPSAHHRIAEHGEDSPEFHRFVSWFGSLAPLPFALGLALDLGLAGWMGVSPVAGLVI